MQLAAEGRLVRRAGQDSPVEKADGLQSADRPPDPSLGQAQISTTGEFTAVDRKRARDPVRRRPEPTDEDGERIGGITIAERGQGARQPVSDIMGKPVRSDLARWREGPADVPQTSLRSMGLQERQLNNGRAFPFGLEARHRGGTHVGKAPLRRK